MVKEVSAPKDLRIAQPARLDTLQLVKATHNVNNVHLELSRLLLEVLFAFNVQTLVPKMM